MNALIRKLEQFVRLSSRDRTLLSRTSSERVRTFGPRVDINREGDKPGDVHLILSGWACRYKLLEDGRRQVVSFFLPGDMCDLNVFILKRMDHSPAFWRLVAQVCPRYQEARRWLRRHALAPHAAAAHDEDNATSQ